MSSPVYLHLQSQELVWLSTSSLHMSVTTKWGQFFIQATVSHVVKTIMSTSFIAGFSSVVFNLKSRFCKEKAWEVSPGVQ
jgi:hypothetical protein